MVPASTTSPGSPSLLLIPTELEARRFEDLGGIAPGFALAAIAGFGPVAAAARTARLLERLRPRRAVLFGIAGAYDVVRHPTGSALVFSRVAMDGIGVGAGERFRSAPKLGFPQWPTRGDDPPLEDVLPLAYPSGQDGGLLLTTCAASDGAGHAAERRGRFPDAVAEDMEGFAVALACAHAGVPLAVVRGISNEVGDRDPGRWRIPGALAAARRLLVELLERDDWGRGA